MLMMTAIHSFIEAIQSTIYFVYDQFDSKISSYVLACSGVFGPCRDCRHLPGEVSHGSAVKRNCLRLSEREHACWARVKGLLTFGILTC